jgi:uncharacterized protein
MNPSIASTESIENNPQKASGSNTIFVGANGLRAGWRLLIFFMLIAVQLGGVVVVARLLHLGPQNRNGQITITPLLLSSNDAVMFLIVCIATLIMGKIEHRRFGEYGLAAPQAFGKDFWFGALLGFGAISGTLLVMFLLGDFRATQALHGTIIFNSLAAWGATFLLVGLFEEFTCRGYMQYTLASGIGFWPAALVISGLFGLGHAFNPGENLVGVSEVVLFGLLLCFFLQRTGNLWCAVGFHMAYDWGQTFFYGVPDSGIVPYHSLLHSTFSGPRWLTGGTVGPEASVLTPIALVAAAVIFSRFYRENRYQVLRPKSIQA